MDSDQQRILDYLTAFRAHKEACERLGRIADLLTTTAKALQERRERSDSRAMVLPGNQEWPDWEGMNTALADCHHHADQARRRFREVSAEFKQGLSSPPGT